MKKPTLLLLILLAFVQVIHAAPTLLWDAPFPDDEVTEHIIYEWKLDNTYVPLATVLMPAIQWDLGILEKRRYRLVVAGVNIMGEGDKSDAVNLPPKPRKPVRVRTRKD